jgi:hypothetical protein
VLFGKEGGVQPGNAAANDDIIVVVFHSAGGFRSLIPLTPLSSLEKGEIMQEGLCPSSLSG